MRSLQQKKFRDEESLFVVEGTKMVNELFRDAKDSIHEVFCTQEWLTDVPSDFEPTVVTTSELERISGLKSPNQVLAVVKKLPEQAVNIQDAGLTLVLDSINDPGNLGTIIRTAEWFGVQQIICSENSVDLYNPKVVQASMGALFRMALHYADLAEILTEFQKNKVAILGAEMAGTDAFENTIPKNAVLIMGSESHGISEALTSFYTPVTIPKYGESESLNVGMATGILVAEWAKSHQ